MLSCYLDSNELCQQFLNHYVRTFTTSHEVEELLKQIQVHDETIWLDLSNQERLLYNQVKHRSNAEMSIATSSHFGMASILGHDLRTNLEHLTMAQFVTATVKDYAQKIQYYKNKIREHLTNNPLQPTDTTLQHYQEKLRDLESRSKFFRVTARLLIPDTELATVSSSDDTDTNAAHEEVEEKLECIICYDDINKETIALGPCGHYVCKTCAPHIDRCPLCKVVGRFTICAETEDISSQDEDGTKVKEIVKHIEKLMTEDPTNSILFFIQFSALAKKMVTTLQRRGIGSLLMTGKDS